MKLELLPIEFFHQLTLRLKDEIELIVISKDSNVMAFGWCLHAAPSYHMLYAGLDYQFNPEFDLYFNLHYAALDRALREAGVQDSCRSIRECFQGEDRLPLGTAVCVHQRALDHSCRGVSSLRSRIPGCSNAGYAPVVLLLQKSHRQTLIAELRKKPRIRC